jgi:hypothetical protein
MSNSVMDCIRIFEIPVIKITNFTWKVYENINSALNDKHQIKCFVLQYSNLAVKGNY